MADGSLLSQLPMLLQYIQLISYIVLSYVFGSVAVRGWRGYLPWYLSLPFRFGAGFVCLLAGISLSPFMGTLNTGLLKFMQIDILTAGLVAGVLFAAGLFLLSYGSRAAAAGMSMQIEKLQKRLDGMKGRPANRTRQAAGGAIILGILIVSLLLFRGFPADMTSELFKTMGLPEEFGQMSPECMSMLTSAMSLSSQELNNPPVYSNDALKAEIESSAGEPVTELYRIVADGVPVVLAVTESGQQCFATESDFCICPPKR